MMIALNRLATLFAAARQVVVDGSVVTTPAPVVVGALHRRGHDRGVDDLAAARDIALGFEMLVEQREQLGD